MVSAVFHSPLEAAVPQAAPSREAVPIMKPAAAATPSLTPVTPGAPAAATRVPFDWRGLWLRVLPPVRGLGLLVLIWELVSVSSTTNFPSPLETFKQAVTVFSDPFYSKGPNDQGIGWNIYSSLKRVAMGFGMAALVGIPLGFMIGRFSFLSRMFNPLISLLRPVSPLAWLPIVTIVVSAVYASADPMFQKSFIVSAITVTLCSLWPTLINTAVGVASIDKDLMNVSKVLRLSTWTKVTKIVLPSSLKLIFTGLRLSLGVGWMVLIAAEMLAQNPGLGKFVWDEFQNGSSHSLGRIMVAVFTIGFVGFILDRIMNTLQQLVSFGEAH